MILHCYQCKTGSFLSYLNHLQKSNIHKFKWIKREVQKVKIKKQQFWFWFILQVNQFTKKIEYSTYSHVLATKLMLESTCDNRTQKN